MTDRPRSPTGQAMTREQMLDEAVDYVFGAVGRLNPRPGERARWHDTDAGDIDLGIVPPVLLSVPFLAPAIRAHFTRFASREANK